MGLYQLYVDNPVRIAIGNFLSKELINNKYIILSFWSFVHLISGGIIMYFLKKFPITKKKKYLYLFALLSIFEIFEFFLYTNLTGLFIPEAPVDVLWDLIIGMLGGLIVDIINTPL